MLIVGIVQAALLCAVLVMLALKKPPVVQVTVPEPRDHDQGPRPPDPPPRDVLRLAVQRELSVLRDYEAEHAERQADRLAKAKTGAKLKKPVRPHGEYDPDQVRGHLLIRLRHLFPALPPDIDQLIRAEVPDEE